MKKLLCILMLSMLLVGCQNNSGNTISTSDNTSINQEADNVLITQDSNLFELLEKAVEDGKFSRSYDSSQDTASSVERNFSYNVDEWGQMKADYGYSEVDGKKIYTFSVGDGAYIIPTTIINLQLEGDRIVSQVLVFENEDWLYGYEPNILGGKITDCYANNETGDATCSDEVLALAKENVLIASTMVKQALEKIGINPTGMSFYPETDISEYTNEIVTP